MSNDNPYQKEDGYLNVERILEEINVQGFLVGNRSIGKTYGFLSDSISKGLESIISEYRLQTLEDFEKLPSLVDTEYQFFFLRRTINQVGAAVKRLIMEEFYQSFIDRLGDHIKDTYEITSSYEGSKDEIVEFYILFRNKPKKERKRIRIGYISSLSSSEKIRGPGFPKVKLIIFDEFQAKRFQDYHKNEPAELQDVYDSIARSRAGTKDCKLVGLGNAGSILNPYFSYYDYDEFNQVKTDKKNGAVIFYHLENEAKRNQAYYDSIQGTAYEKYSAKNEFSDDSSYNIIRLKKAASPRRILYNVKLGRENFGVWIDGERHTILSRIVDETKSHLVDDVPIGNEMLDMETYYLLANQIKDKNLYFDAADIRLIAEKHLRKYLFKCTDDWKII